MSEPVENFSVDSWLRPGMLLRTRSPLALTAEDEDTSKRRIKPFFLEDFWPKRKSFPVDQTFLFIEAKFRVVSPGMFGEEFGNDHGTICASFHLLDEEKKYSIEMETFLESYNRFSDKQAQNIKTAFLNAFEIISINENI